VGSRVSAHHGPGEATLTPVILVRIQVPQPQNLSIPLRIFDFYGLPNSPGSGLICFDVNGMQPKAVVKRLAFFSSRIDVSDALASLHLEAHPLDAALRNAFALSERWLAAPPVEMKSLVLDIVERVTIAANRIDIWLNRAPR
jgi:hypothetical protein